MGKQAMTSRCVFLWQEGRFTSAFLAGKARATPAGTKFGLIMGLAGWELCCYWQLAICNILYTQGKKVFAKNKNVLTELELGFTVSENNAK